MTAAVEETAPRAILFGLAVNCTGAHVIIDARRLTVTLGNP